MSHAGEPGELQILQHGAGSADASQARTQICIPCSLSMLSSCLLGTVAWLFRQFMLQCI
jgi:hypothetical protein